MSNAESIVEVLYQHPAWSEGFYAGWPGWAVWCSGCGAPLTDADALAAHQAEMIAAALEPVIREAQAAAVRDSARYIERLAPKGLVSRDAVLADLEIAAGRIGRGRYANGTHTNPYDTKEEA